MELLCHRCGSTLREGEAYCSNCGAPQFLVDSADSASPAQPAVRVMGDPRRIQWRVAVTTALLMAIPLGLVSGIAGTSLIIVLGAGVVTMWLYQRRAPGLCDARTGWRIGATLGAAAALLATAVYAARMLVQRYMMHGGAAIDGEFQASARQAIDVWKNANAQQGVQQADLAHAIKITSAFLLSPDGHAAMQLLLAVTMSVGILLFSALGGALGGWWQASRARTHRPL